MKHQQLSIFPHSSNDITISVDCTEVKENFHYKVHSVIVDGKLCHGIIKNSFRIDLTMYDISNLITGSINIRRRVYGYEIYTQRNGKFYQYFIRFGNMSTSSKSDINEFIGRGFERKQHETQMD